LRGYDVRFRTDAREARVQSRRATSLATVTSASTCAERGNFVYHGTFGHALTQRPPAVVGLVENITY
jgi:hypothetical protein